MAYIDTRYISEKMYSRQTFPLRFLPFLQHVLWCVIQTSDGNFKQSQGRRLFFIPSGGSSVSNKFAMQVHDHQGGALKPKVEISKLEQQNLVSLCISLPQKMIPSLKNEIWPKSRPKVINSSNKSHMDHIWGMFEL